MTNYEQELLNEGRMIHRISSAIYRTYSKPLPWWVILFGNPVAWYRKRFKKFFDEGEIKED